MLSAHGALKPGKIIIKDIKNIRRVHTYPSLREKTPFSVLWKSIFFRGISLPSTDITHIRIKYSLKRDFLKNALQRGERSISLRGSMKKENYRKRDVRVSDLVRNKNVSLYWGKMFKLVIGIGLLLSPVSKIEALNDSAEVDKQRLGGTFYTNVLCT